MKLQLTGLLILLSLFSSFALDVNDQAKPFSLKTLGGETFTLAADGSDSGPTLLVFWATWCAVCKEEIPHVQEIANSFKEKGLRVLAINVGVNDSEKRAGKFKQKYKMNYPISFDTGSKVTKEYGVMGTPTVMIIDKGGVVRYKASSLPEKLHEHYDSLMK